MATLIKIKRQKGFSFRIKYYKDGQQFAENFPAGTDIKLVKSRKLQIENELVNSSNPAVGIQSPTLAHYKSIYIEKRRNEIDIKRSVHTLNIMIDYWGPHINLDKLSHDRIQQFRDDLLNDKLAKIDQSDFEQEHRARRGVNKELSYVRTILTWAYRKEYLQHNPFDRVDFLKAKAPSTNILPRDKEEQFYNNLPFSDIRLVYSILRYTGMRRGECLELRERNILLDEGFIWFEKTKNREEEYIPIHNKLKTILQIHNASIFTGDRDRKLFSYDKDYVSQAFRRTLDKIGLHHIKSPAHMLRHTFGARIMESDPSDKNERVAQELLRHKTTKMTKRYTQIARENLKTRFNDIDI